VAADLYGRASDSHPRRAYYCVRAAVVYSDLEDEPATAAWLAKAGRIGMTDAERSIQLGLAAKWAEALALLPEDDALEDELFISVRFSALRGLGRVDDAIDFLEKAIERYPLGAGHRIELAYLYLHRSQTPGPRARIADKTRALELALEARDLRRAWGGPSGKAVEIACNAAAGLGDFAGAVRLGTPPPRGDATAAEAGYAAVQMTMSELGHLTGDVDLLEELSRTEATGKFGPAFIRAEALLTNGGPSDEARDAYLQAWALASTEEEKMRLWLGMAAAGPDEMPGADELAARTDEIPLIVEGAAPHRHG
jgi:tetratricopeptide (TPR) repeat protein